MDKKSPGAITFEPDNLLVAFCIKTNEELQQAHHLFSMALKPAFIWALKRGLPIKEQLKKSVYSHFSGGETVEDAKRVMEKLAGANVRAVLDYAAEAQQTEAGYDQVQQELLHDIRRAAKSGASISLSIRLSKLGPKSIFEKITAQEQLTTEEQQAFDRTEARLDSVCKAVANAGMCMHIDAEESWQQVPVDALAEKMMLRYNSQRAVVLNTVQMYRTDRVDYLKACLERFAGKQALLGIKLVRGAFHEKELERARVYDHAPAVFTEKVATDKSFNQGLDICLYNLHRLELCAATHNQESTRYLTERMAEGELKLLRHRVHFAQLYGMSDHLTFNLAQAGFQASKYLPYGEAKKALPHIIRRVEESASVSGQTGRELHLLEGELRRRSLL
ncbi:proline dehydrogenase family protein [Pontibacter ruber]|uniref:Proline dehydrogenase family protein n=1 Tax=Pontibacter ruber TaxID=1343895 RepID=A0ABW5CT18_9BACT|nr:proline dehydrogenase family protein [Pontibacter ruber]